jgi:hypothetical protein
MVPPRPLPFPPRQIPTSCPLFPNSHGIISFADPHLLNPFTPYRYKNHRGWGAVPNLQTCKPSNLPTFPIPLTPLRTRRRVRILSDHRESKGSSPRSSRFSPDFVFSLSLLGATLTDMPISVHSKALTGKLNPLDATLTKNQGPLLPAQTPLVRRNPCQVPRRRDSRELPWCNL